MPERDELPPKQRQAITCLMTARNLTEAAAAAGVSLRTLQRWLDDPAFTAALRTATDDALHATARRLAAGSGLAVDALTSAMSDETTTGAKIRAADVWLNQTARIAELAELEQRLTKLETVIEVRYVDSSTTSAD